MTSHRWGILFTLFQSLQYWSLTSFLHWQNFRNLSTYFNLFNRRSNFTSQFLYEIVVGQFYQRLHCCCLLCTCPDTTCCISLYAMSCWTKERLGLILTLLHGPARHVLLLFSSSGLNVAFSSTSSLFCILFVLCFWYHHGWCTVDLYFCFWDF